MNNIGKLTTFARLLKEETVIMIPKVQRDYAYGRIEPKVIEVLNGMLDTMFKAVRDDKSELFDFVYGGSYVKKSNEGLIPLDGQQRLTTLFLLHFFASVVQPEIQQDKDGISVDTLKKFRYETRQTATDFCDALVGNIRNEIIPSYNYSEGKPIKELIKNSPKFLPSYDSDPTIVSMLNVLEIIEQKYLANPIENLWDKLTTRDNIQFYALSLEKFGLSDDLYIKMNSRGKKLTNFEIFKSDLEKAINKIAPSLKDDLSKKIDNEWMDILWDYANLFEYENDADLIKKADDGFMNLLNNIFRIELFRRGIETSTKRNALIEEIITDEESISRIISILDTLSDIHKNGGIESHWQQYFYFSNNVVGEDDKIRLFWRQEQSQKPVFHLAIDRELSVPEIVYFYALYRLKSTDTDFETSFRSLRIVRNLVTSNVDANRAQYKMLYGFLSDVDCIINAKGNVPDNDGYTYEFIGTAVEEERNKIHRLSKEDYNSLLRFENHNILRGSVILFVDAYLQEDSTLLFEQLKHFELIFNNDWANDFEKYRINFIQPEKYMQYDPSMENEKNITRRFFIHNPNDFSLFFIKNERRKNQEAILRVLKNYIKTTDDFKSGSEICENYEIDTWQYYYVKYPSSNIYDTKYGCYAWDEIDNKPLEMVILNSSYHSAYNIEWKMLNRILFCELKDMNINVTLNNHSDPLVLNDYGISFDITQQGWQIACNDNKVIDALENDESFKVSVVGEETPNLHIVDFGQNDDFDYIDLAKQIVDSIKSVYSTMQKELIIEFDNMDVESSKEQLQE